MDYKIIENVAEMTTHFWKLVHEGVLNLDDFKYSPWEVFRSNLSDWAYAFEDEFEEGNEYLDQIAEFTKNQQESPRF